MRTAASLVSALVFALIPTLAFAYDAGNCLDFDGVDDYAAEGGLSTSLTNITLEAWVYHRTVPASIQRYVYLQGTGSNDVAVIRHDGVAQPERLHFYISTNGTYRHIRVDDALQAGKWRHVVGTWDGTTQRLFLDGEEVGTNTPGGNLDAGDGYVLLSDYYETMDGYLDEVRIWNDARTPEEIRSNMYRSLSGSESGLEGYWKLNETSGSTAYDSAGSVDLDLSGGMTNDDWVTSGAFSGPRNALEFDGTDDYVSIPSSPTLDNGQFTTEFWAQMPSSGAWDGIIDKGRDTNNDWYFLTRTSALGEGVVFGIGSGSSRAELSYSWSDAAWHHVAGSYEGTTMTLYVDGVQRGSRTASMSVTTNNIHMGSRRNGTYPFDGKLEEVRIWDDVRTPEEIREHMCKTLVGNESNLAAYWRFDQQVGTTLYDITANDNDGTLTNMTDGDWASCEAFTTWIGCAGTDWATAANWSLGAVPNSISTNVGIPSYTGGKEPTMAGDYACNHLSVTSGATYTISSGWTLTLNGNAYSLGSTTGDGEVDLTGASAAHAVAGTFENVELNDASGAELAGDGTINGTLTLTDGALSISTNTLTLNGLISQASGSLTGGSSSNIMFGGTGVSTDLPALSLNDLTINRPNGIGLAGAVIIDGTLTLTNGAFTVGTNTLTLKNAIGGTAANLSAGNTSSITIAGSGTGVNIPGSVTELNNVTLNNTNGTTLQNDLELDGTLTLTNGALSIATNTLTLNGLISQASGSLTGGSSSNIMFGGTGVSTDLPALSLNDLTINRPNGIGLAGAVIIDGALTLTNGAFTVGTNTLTLKNAISGTPSNLSADNTSSITIAGSGTGINIPSSVTELNNVTLNNTNGTTLQNGLELDGTLTLTNGALSIASNTLTLNGLISLGSGGLTGGSSSNIVFGGAGASTNLPAVSLNELTINRSNGIGLAGDVLMDGALTLTAGTFTVGANTLTLKNAIAGTATNLSAGNTSSITIAGSGTGVNIPSSVTELSNLSLDNTNGTALQNDLELDGTLTLTDGDLDLSGHTLTLGATATLSETDGNTVKGDSGTLTTRRTFTAGDLSTGEDIAGMGAEITTEASLGQTSITRGHAAQNDSTWASILRYFDITPTNNSGLDATLVFHYDDSELNGLTESELELRCSTDSGSTWSYEGGTVDTGNETIVLGGIDALSRWTAFEFPWFAHTVSLAGVLKCSVAWGDYDNDGDLDVLMAGFDGSSRITRIYRNDGSGTFTDIVAELPGVEYCSVAWGDYDNDGDLDVLMAGFDGSGRITRIYRNDGSDTFTDIGAGLTGVSSCRFAWGDYDNDGDLDVLVAGDTGSGYITRIYRNDDSGTFTDIVAGLPGVTLCSVAWGDYDNDGDLDVLLAGYTGSTRITRIYRNDAGAFTNISAGLTGVDRCSAAWGDYDNDGGLDVLMAGHSSGSGRITRIYGNEGSDTFTDIGAGLTTVENCGVAWGDYDNDGDLDVLLAGFRWSGNYTTRIHRNDGSGTFTNIGAGLPGVSHCSVAWGDYDNDGDLDVLLAGDTGSGYITRIYRNDNRLGNTVPNAPTNLAAVGSGEDVALSWDKATDVETEQNALSYNLRIGTTSGGVDTESPMADVGTGWRRVPALGNTNHNNSWTIKGLNDTTTYYWSVQAIDNAFAGSGFAAEGFFTVDLPAVATAAITSITTTTATCGGEVTHEGASSVTAKGIVWDTSEDPTVGVHLGMTNDGSGMGSFVSYLTDLTPVQTYYVRAYATNAEHTAYGVEKVFATNMIPPGNGLDFDGSNDYVQLTQNSGLPIYNNGTDDAYTVSMWIKGGVQSDKRVFAEGNTASNTPLFAIGAGTGGSDGVRIFIRDDGNDTKKDATSTSAVFDGTWHHISWVDSSGTATLYVDGKPDATDFSYTRGTLTLNRTGIGAILRASPSNYFTGEIDEVCLWNTARSQGETQADMNKVLNGDEAGLVAYYRFDHLSGTALSDRTINANHGTLMNMDDADWVTSAASIGHESHIGAGTGNLSENADVPVDITWDADPGADAIFAAIQVDDLPDVVTGLPANYDSTYWELWIADDDGSYQADAAFHYDNLGGISDETTLALYTRTAPGQSWSLVGGTTIDYEGSTTDGIGSINANDLTAFSQFIVAGGNEMTLTGAVQLDTLVLEWSTVPPASAYWVYGVFNEPYFDPQVESPFGYRQAVTADTSWSSPAGIADPDTNWTYQVIAVDGSEQEIIRSNRFGEHEFLLP